MKCGPMLTYLNVNFTEHTLNVADDLLILKLLFTTFINQLFFHLAAFTQKTCKK